MKFNLVITSRNSVKLQIWNVWQEFREDENGFPAGDSREKGETTSPNN